MATAATAPRTTAAAPLQYARMTWACMAAVTLHHCCNCNANSRDSTSTADAVATTVASLDQNQCCSTPITVALLPDISDLTTQSNCTHYMQLTRSMIGMRQSVLVMTTVVICISMASASILHNRLSTHSGPESPLPNVSTTVFLQATLGIFGDLDRITGLSVKSEHQAWPGGRI